jgi:hypothetical protein
MGRAGGSGGAAWSTTDESGEVPGGTAGDAGGSRGVGGGRQGAK